jgi:leucyl-tRNA synthetase
VCLWAVYGNKPGIGQQDFPVANETYLQEDTFEYPVSFNGKLRYKLLLPLAMQTEEIEKIVIEEPQSRKWIEGRQIKKIIVVHGKIINIVVS